MESSESSQSRPPAGLTGRESRVIAGVLEHATHRAAAKALKLHRSTVDRIMSLPHVQEEYRRQRAELVKSVTRKLRSIGMEAVETLQQVMRDPEAGPSRVTAAAKALEMLIRASEHEELVERIEALERAQQQPGQAA